MLVRDLIDSLAGADLDAEVSYDVHGRFYHLKEARVEGTGVVVVLEAHDDATGADEAAPEAAAPLDEPADGDSPDGEQLDDTDL